MIISDRFGRTLCATFGLLITLHGLARAQPTTDELRWAENLVAEGRVLRARNDLDGALRRFLAADKLLHAPTTALEVAQMQDVLGSLVEARRTLARLLELPAPSGDPPALGDVRAQAQKLDEDLQHRLVRLRFELSGFPAGATPSVFIDDNRTPVPADVPLAVNPGRHSIVAKAGTQEVTRLVDARESDNITVALAFRASPNGDANAATESGSDPQAAGTRGLPKVAYLGLGIGAAGVVVGGVTGFLAIMAKKSAERGCAASRCPPPLAWDGDQTQRALAKASAAGLVVGAVGVGLAIGSILLQKKSKTVGSSPARDVGASIRINPVLGGMAVSGQF